LHCSALKETKPYCISLGQEQMKTQNSKDEFYSMCTITKLVICKSNCYMLGTGFTQNRSPELGPFYGLNYACQKYM
jgi:hypothetical protein